MSIGLCCQYIEPKTKRNGSIEYKNIVGEKKLLYSNFKNNKYSLKDIENVWIHNTKSLYNIILRIKSEGYSSFRVSSSLLPLFDELPNELHSSELVKNNLIKIGNFVKQYNMRLTTHPDQFVVLSSDSDDVINKSINILNHHAWVFDTMGLDQSPYYAINIHGGKKGNIKKLINSVNKLNDNLKSRLTLENDEIAYNVNDLYSVYENCGIPICFDSHHYTFNDGGLDLEKSFDKAISTWKNVKPLTHLSNTSPEFVNGNFMERRKHSDYVHYIPDIQKEYNNAGLIDIDFEFKMKNIAIKKAVNEFELIL